MMSHHNIMINIKAMLEQAGPPVTDECCIYKVPFDIRKFNEDAYTPKVVSIGPFHHNHNPRLRNMERHKLIYCNSFLERTQTSLSTWISYIEKVVVDFRRCYSETLEFSMEELVKIIFVDSGFIFELFWKSYHNEWSENDTFLIKPLLADTISVDLLLLENQLPFFVLSRLFNLSFSTESVGANDNIPSFIELTFSFFAYYNRSNLSFNNIRIRHFNDLIRTFHLQHPREKRPRRIEETDLHLPSATELFEAGLRFKVNDQSDCLLDLRFSGGILEMPQLKVEDRTETLFRNMLALEQHHYPYESYITDYTSILDFLINTSRDVDILVQKRILVNWLGDTDSVANLFNSLGKNITRTNFNSHYTRLGKELNVFHSNPCNNLKRTLRRDYCNSPWQTAASVAGIVLLIFSLIQTVCSVLQVIPH